MKVCLIVKQNRYTKMYNGGIFDCRTKQINNKILFDG